MCKKSLRLGGEHARKIACVHRQLNWNCACLEHMSPMRCLTRHVAPNSKIRRE
jgi:hypothetical protein